MDKTCQRIKDLREDNDLTQIQFAEILQTTQRRISYIENGISAPTIEEIRIIYKRFNVDIYWLLGIAKNTKDNP